MSQRLWLLALACLTAAPVRAESTPVHEYKLDNGLQLLIKVDQRAPVVVSQVWYKVGSSYEHSGITGISHVLEHMMFKGTSQLGPNEFSRIISANGGRENAFTSRDYTGYYQQLEKGRLEISFKLESDRMRNLKLDPAEFAKEINVVMEERRLRTEDDPSSITAEQFNAIAHINSPYHNPVIGWMNDLQNMTVADLEEWYERWYAPNNATLVVVGDVEPDATFELAKKYFGELKPSDIPVTKPRQEIEQRGTRRITVKAPAELPVLIMGFPTPSVRNAAEEWEPYALEVLSYVLDGGDSARFSTDLIRGSQVAVGIGTGYNLYARHDDLFSFSGTPSPERSVADLENAILEQIKRIQETPPTAQEMDRVKAQIIASDIYQRDSVFYQAQQLGSLVSSGLDWRLHEQYVPRIREVTPEQVQAVAKKYLVTDRMTVAQLDPQPLSAPIPAAATP